MAASVSLTLLESETGVALSEGDTPEDLVISSVAGEDKLNVTWSKNAPLGTPTDTIVVRYQAIDLVSLTDGVGWYVDIFWGDGTSDRFPVGWSADFEAQHTYSTAGPHTITSTLLLRYIDITLDTDPVVFTPTLDGDFKIDQIQIEKHEQGVQILEPDWLPISRIDSMFVDDRVNRAFTYKYRYRFRVLDTEDQPLVTSQFSNIIEQPSWA